jgi:hypothetical protein
MLGIVVELMALLSLLAMEDKELVCNLTAADYRDREAAWLKVGNYVSVSAAVPGGLRVRFAPTRGLADSLTELVRLEAECCAWMDFAMSESPDGISLSITSLGEEGERAVRETFSGLVRPTGSGAPLTT